jgi:hypothetical protein
MNSYTTVASARVLLGDLFDSSDFIPYINQATERLINGGLWKGVISYAAFPTVDNYFALPYPFLSVIGAQWFRCPVPVFGQFHDFVIGGPGQPIVNMPPEGIVEDMGDGYATAVDPPDGGGTLRIVLDLLIDVGKTFRIFGDGSTREVFSLGVAGMEIVTTGLTTNNATVFTKVTGIQPPVTATGANNLVGGFTLYSVDGSGTATELGYYYPNQTTPQFRRYRIGVTSATSTDIPFAVTVLVRKRWIPVYNETDYIFPGNIGALKFAMQAIDNEASKNPAGDLWQQSLDALDKELHATRGAARPEAAYETLGSWAGFNNCW